MKKTSKRVWSLFLICVMLLMLFPVVALATDDADAERQLSLFEQTGDWFRSTFDFIAPANLAVITNGQFPTSTVLTAGENGIAGIPGAPWRLYNNGTLVVDGGFMHSPHLWETPWHSIRAQINRVEFTGQIIGGRYLRNLFRYMPNLATIDGLGLFDTSNTIDMSSMFAGHNVLTSLDLSGWDTSNVIHMGRMFTSANSLTSLDLSSWDTSSVLDMGGMFSFARNLTSLDLSGWDTRNVIGTDSMFAGTHRLTDLDVSHFDTRSLRSMSRMFWEAHGLTTLDLSGWDTSNVTNMYMAFTAATNLTSLDLSGWDTGNVTNMRYTFASTWRLSELDVSHFDTGNVRDMSNTFRYAGATTLDLSNWDTRNVTDMNQMFSGALVTALDLSSFDTSRVGNMQRMFARASNLTALDLSNFDTASAAGSMCFMFAHQGNDLRAITLGENFVFGCYHHGGFLLCPCVYNPDICPPYCTCMYGGECPCFPIEELCDSGFFSNSPYTGRWQTLGNGTLLDPRGAFVFTPEELAWNFNNNFMAGMADTWVWEPWEENRPVQRIIALNRSGTDTPFTAQSVGYTRLLHFSTVVQNISDAPTGGLTVTISGPDAEAFELIFISRPASIGVYYVLPAGSTASTLEIPSLAAGNAANLYARRRFMIQPVGGLAAGTHTARVTVSVDNHPSGEFDEYFDVVFIVE